MDEERPIDVALTAPEARGLIEEIATVQGATSVERGQTPLLDKLTRTLVQQYREATGTQLVLPPTRLPRARGAEIKLRKGGL